MTLEEQFFLLTAIAISGITFSCSTPAIEAEEPPVTISYRILDHTGQPAQSIKEGTNFIFSLVITNLSDQEWYVDHGGILGSNITWLYKAGSDRMVGRAYLSATCSFQAGVAIPGKGEYRLDIPWVASKPLTRTPSCAIAPSDHVLPSAGRYITRMNGKIRVFRGSVVHEIPMNRYDLSFEIR